MKRFGKPWDALPGKSWKMTTEPWYYWPETWNLRRKIWENLRRILRGRR
jgi:hypothetical protein